LRKGCLLNKSILAQVAKEAQAEDPARDAPFLDTNRSYQHIGLPDLRWVEPPHETNQA
jgi:hypothetical protein